MVDQVGGDHYRSRYGHWDWVAETRLGYLEGNATKYLTRWRLKNGRQDLEKASSYVKKLMSVPGLHPARYRGWRSPECLNRYLQSTEIADLPEARLISLIDNWGTIDDLVVVLLGIQELINESD